MDITKRAKRWMATVMTTALALTSLVVAPKSASAAEVPTVEVKGATLRLDGTADGKQSMRIGVVIKKADLATACGIQIEYNGKTTIIATDTGYDKIYDYDETKQEVVYTAVITGIPSTAFRDDFTITGLVKGTDDEEYKTSSPVEKSIDGIVKSLGTDYKLADGILVKKASELDIQQPNDGLYAWEQAVVDNGCATDVVMYNGENCLKVSTGSREETKTVDGEKVTETVIVQPSVQFKFPDKTSAGRKFWLEVDACSNSGYEIKSYSPDVQKSDATNKFVQTSLSITGNGAYGYETFKVKPITETDDLYVKSFAVYEAVSDLYDDMEIDRGLVTLSAANEVINDQMNKISYADGKANVEKMSRENGGYGVAYNIKPEGERIDLSQYSKVTFNITSETDIAICVNLLNNVPEGSYWDRIKAPAGSVKYWPSIMAGTHDYAYNISDLKGNLTEAQAIFIKYNPPAKGTDESAEEWAERWKTIPDATFTINSIQFE